MAGSADQQAFFEHVVASTVVSLSTELEVERNALNSVLMQRHSAMLEKIERDIWAASGTSHSSASHSKPEFSIPSEGALRCHATVAAAPSYEHTDVSNVELTVGIRDDVEDAARQELPPQLLEPDVPSPRSEAVSDVPECRTSERISGRSDTSIIFDTMSTTVKPHRFSSCVDIELFEMDEELERMVHGTIFQAFVLDPKFELGFTLLIILSTIGIACEIQYVGIDLAAKLDMPGSGVRAKDEWPGFKTFYDSTEMVFGVLFTLEVLLKLAALRLQFFNKGWNWLDASIIVAWLAGLFQPSIVGGNPMLLRTFRLVKMVRVLRLIKWVEMLDALHILIGAIKASVSVLTWSTMLIVTIVVIVALIASVLLRDSMEDDDKDLEVRQAMFRYFGTFTRACVSCFEVSMGNWVPIVRFLMENSSEWWAFFLLAFRIVVEFSVVKVITGVFMHETFKVVNNDDHLMVIQKRRALQNHMQKMNKLMSDADSAQLGYLTLPDFVQYVEQPAVQTWLAAMDMQVSDAETIYKLLDGEDGDGKLTVQEIVSGVAHLKGAARSVDMVHLLNSNAGFQMSIHNLFAKQERRLDAISQSLSHLGGDRLPTRNASLPTRDKDALETKRSSTIEQPVVKSLCLSTLHPKERTLIKACA